MNAVVSVMTLATVLTSAGLLAAASGAGSLEIDPGRAEVSSAKVSQTASGAVRIEFMPNRPDARVKLRPPTGAWDLTGGQSVRADVTNRGKRPCAVLACLDGHKWCNTVVVVEPGKTETLVLVLRQAEPPDGLAKRFPGMRGLPGGFVWLWDQPDLQRVRALWLEPIGNIPPETVEVENLRYRKLADGVGDEPLPTDDAVFPFVDRYGQYMHRDWPGKVHKDADFAARKQAEDADLRKHPGPADWDPYGGWKGGPKRKATGHFRVEKLDGRWWLVDPEGRLFWSHGVTGVKATTKTKVKGRERCFAEIPVGAKWTWDALAGNLAIKYGPSWRDAAADRMHARLRSWGLNTIANWTDEDVYLSRKARTPYVVNVPYTCPRNGKLPDVSSPQFRAGLRKGLEAVAEKTADDPWCIGYFIDNELPWKNDEALAEVYFRTCREEMRRAAAKKLYLGCRFHFHQFPQKGPKVPVRAAAKYCDVISFNRYRYTAGDLRLPDGCDKPIVIGEFHFGALDRGMLHTGLRGVGSQAQRGAVYRMYLRTALANPAIVGTHWFQYNDQAVTGRGDGENYQIGFIDICDTPYPETIAATRTIGSRLYHQRTAK